MNKFKEDTCCICCEQFEKNFIPLQPCNHYIHKKCIYKWGKLECPICRTSLLFKEDTNSLIIKNLICLFVWFIFFSVIDKNSFTHFQHTFYDNSI